MSWIAFADASASTICASASRFAASSVPSALRICACLSPSAVVIVARFVRSAAACFSMACCIDSEGRMSRTSALFTTIPQSEASVAMPSLRRALISSRRVSASSISMCPTMARSVVMMRFWMA